MIKVRYKPLLKRLQVDKIGYVPKLNQITHQLLHIKNSFLQAHRQCTLWDPMLCAQQVTCSIYSWPEDG